MFHNFSITRFHGQASSTISVLACLTMLSFSTPVFSEYYNPATDWMVEGVYGLHFKYLNAIYHDAITPAEFNEYIDAFDAVAFAEDVAETGASWVLWPLGRTWYNSPNTTLEAIVGDFTSDRDLPLDISAELKKYGIRLMLYLSCDKGKNSEDLPGKILMGWDEANDRYTQTFVDNWASAMRVWSDRYGTRVSGWWVDHCRAPLGVPYTIPHLPLGVSNPVLRTYWEALSSGNPDAVFAWNRKGTNRNANTPEDDYTSGHQLIGVGLEEAINDPINRDGRWRNGIQFHFLFYMGNHWGQPGLSYTNAEMTDFFTSLRAVEGTATISMFVYKTPGETASGVQRDPGNLEDVQIAQMAKLKALKDGLLPSDDCL